MVPFAGFQMPVRYSSDIEEHLTVRKAVGVFDVSHMGEFLLEGPNALDLVQRVTSNDASKLFDGKVQYSCLPNKTGGIVDDLLVYRINSDTYYLVVNASNIEKDWQWIQQFNTRGVKMTNLSDQVSLLSVQGPQAAAAVQPLTGVKLSEMPYYTFQVATFAGIPDVIISATGYTGAGGFELYIPNASAEHVWKQVFQSGASFGIKPIGLGARDTLRLEMGFCLYGNDIDDTTSPIEAGLSWITKFTKDFTNSEQLRKQKEQGVSRKLVAFELKGRSIPRAHYPIFNSEGNSIGHVTSGTQSPSLGRGIGMGYVSTAYAEPGTAILIGIRDQKVEAHIVTLPFIRS